MNRLVQKEQRREAQPRPRQDGKEVAENHAVLGKLLGIVTRLEEEAFGRTPLSRRELSSLADRSVELTVAIRRIHYCQRPEGSEFRESVCAPSSKDDEDRAAENCDAISYVRDRLDVCLRVGVSEDRRGMPEFSVFCELYTALTRLQDAVDDTRRRLTKQFDITEPIHLSSVQPNALQRVLANLFQAFDRIRCKLLNP